MTIGDKMRDSMARCISGAILQGMSIADVINELEQFIRDSRFVLRRISEIEKAEQKMAQGMCAFQTDTERCVLSAGHSGPCEMESKRTGE